MEPSLEYNYLLQNLQANKYLKALVENDITQLLMIVQERRKVVNQIEQLERDLMFKINSIKDNPDKPLVAVNYSDLPFGYDESDNL